MRLTIYEVTDKILTIRTDEETVHIPLKQIIGVIKNTVPSVTVFTTSPKHLDITIKSTSDDLDVFINALLPKWETVQ